MRNKLKFLMNIFLVILFLVGCGNKINNNGTINNNDNNKELDSAYYKLKEKSFLNLSNYSFNEYNSSKKLFYSLKLDDDVFYNYKLIGDGTGHTNINYNGNVNNIDMEISMDTIDVLKHYEKLKVLDTYNDWKIISDGFQLYLQYNVLDDAIIGINLVSGNIQRAKVENDEDFIALGKYIIDNLKVDVLDTKPIDYHVYSINGKYDVLGNEKVFLSSTSSDGAVNVLGSLGQEESSDEKAIVNEASIKTTSDNFWSDALEVWTYEYMPKEGTAKDYIKEKYSEWDKVEDVTAKGITAECYKQNGRLNYIIYTDYGSAISLYERGQGAFSTDKTVPQEHFPKILRAFTIEE